MDVQAGSTAENRAAGSKAKESRKWENKPAFDLKDYHFISDQSLIEKTRSRVQGSRVREVNKGGVLREEVCGSFVTFGWRERSVADLEGLKALLSRNESTLAKYAETLTEGLKLFELELDRSWTFDELLAESKLLREMNISIKRDDLRFFFTTSFTRDGILQITVFLEATPGELASRPAQYVNTDKNLFTTYFSENGVVRRTDKEFEREAKITRTTENTAYSKIYISPWEGTLPGIAAEIHPMQRARLLCVANRDPVCGEYAQATRDLGGLLKKVAARVNASGFGSSYKTHILKDIGNLFIELSRCYRKGNFLDSSHKYISKITALSNQLPQGSHFRIELPRGAKRRHTSVNYEIKAALRRAKQVQNILTKAKDRREAQYLSADETTGMKRELVFFAISDILKRCIESATKMPVHRFMLSSKQIDRIRLFRESDTIRERIKEVPLKLEKIRPTYEMSIPLLKREEDGSLSDKTETTPVSMVVLDRELATAIEQKRRESSL